jgi:hypothetical protein
LARDDPEDRNMTTTTFPGPLWFREIVGGALVLVVALVVVLPLALTAGSNVQFGIVAAAAGLGLAAFGGFLIILGLRARRV